MKYGIVKNILSTFNGRLYAVSLLFIFLSLLTINIVCCLTVKESFENSLYESNKNAIESFKENTNKMLEKVIWYNNKFLMDNSINGYVQNYAQCIKDNSYAKDTERSNIQQELLSLMNLNQGIAGVELLAPDYTLRRGQVHDKSYYQDISELKQKSTQSVTIIPNSNPSNGDKKSEYRFKLIGLSSKIPFDWYTVLNIDPDVFASGKNIVILSKSGEIIWSNMERLPSGLVRAILSNSNQKYDGSFDYSDGAGKKSILYTRSMSNNWIYANVITDSEINQEIDKCFSFSALISVVLLAISGTLAFYITRRLTKPIYDLATRIRNIRDVEANTPNYHEFGGYWFGKWGFKNKVILVYCTMTVLLCIIYISAFYTYINNSSNKVANEIVSVNMEVIKNNIDLEVKNFEQIAYYLTANKVIQNLIDYGELNDVNTGIISRIMVSEDFLKGNISSIELIDKSQNKIYSTDPNVTKTSDVDKLIISGLMNKREHAAWMPAYINLLDNYQIPYIRKIWTWNEQKQQYGDGGYIIVNMDESLIENQLGKTTNIFFENSVLIDDGGTIISAKDKSLIGQTLKISKAEVVQTNPDINLAQQSNNNIYILNFGKNGWKLITTVSQKAVLRNANRMLLIGVIAVCIMAVMFMFIVSMILNKLLRPIYQIKEGIAEILIGNLGVNDFYGKNNDLNVLCSDIYEMVSQSNKLLNELYSSKLRENELEVRKKEAELISLQCQINPHFLYNTFTTIKILVELAQLDQAKEMVTSLGKLFRRSVFRGQILVKVSEEIEHAQAYADIQRIRFGDKVKFIWNLDEKIFEYETLKFILQPVLENAIQYGIEYDKSTSVIEISSFVQKDRLIFEITDNGPGISPEKLSQLNMQIDGLMDTTSVGLKNINERIKLYFGKEYGISITSELGKMTLIRIDLKLLKPREE